MRKSDQRSAIRNQLSAISCQRSDNRSQITDRRYEIYRRLDVKRKMKSFCVFCFHPQDTPGLNVPFLGIPHVTGFKMRNRHVSRVWAAAICGIAFLAHRLAQLSNCSIEYQHTPSSTAPLNHLRYSAIICEFCGMVFLAHRLVKL